MKEQTRSPGQAGFGFYESCKPCGGLRENRSLRHFTTLRYIFSFLFAVSNGYAGLLELRGISSGDGIIDDLIYASGVLGVFIVVGLMCWKRPNTRIILLALISIAETISKWFLGVRSADLTLICTMPLLTANVQGSTRRLLVYTAFYAGHNVGRDVWIIVVAFFESEGLTYRFAAEAIKPALLVAYAIWIARKNRIRTRVVIEMAVSEEDSRRFEELAAAADMTDIESVHFRYRY